jgi:hypothetical protein
MGGRIMSTATSARIRETVNECGTPVVEYLCQGSCAQPFTVCPAPKPEEDNQWTGCLGIGCSSYDPGRDADKLFDDGDVISFERRRNPGIVQRRPVSHD